MMRSYISPLQTLLQKTVHMPELPEVETTRRGILPHVCHHRIEQVIVRESRLRWPVPPELPAMLEGQTINSVQRRARYLLLSIGNGTLIIHLGMSGCLRILPVNAPVMKHDHIDLVLETGSLLRLTDPRRFGAMLWTREAIQAHPLVRKLGPEPLSPLFTGKTLYQQSRNRKQVIKTFIMDNHIVAGIGNIYANEVLFRAGIRPDCPAGQISLARYQQLELAVRDTLGRAIAQGGTTLRDFVGSDGKPGYFRVELAMYGRAGEPCTACGTVIQKIRLGNRSTCFCPQCQRC